MSLCLAGSVLFGMGWVESEYAMVEWMSCSDGEFVAWYEWRVCELWSAASLNERIWAIEKL